MSMDTKAVLSQALEALEDMRNQMLHRGVLTDPEHPDRIALNNGEAAITSLRAALAEGEREDKPVAWRVDLTFPSGVKKTGYFEREEDAQYAMTHPQCVKTALYESPSPAALRAAVIDAYERAAREVDACMIGFADDDSELIEIAAAIRKLKETK